MTEIFKNGGGLALLPKDDRDLHLAALKPIALLTELPERFYIAPLSIKNQIADGNDDHCSGYSVAVALEPQEGAILFPTYSFAASKKISGNVDEWGQDLRSAMKAPVKYGIPEEADVPEEIRKLSINDRRIFMNYGSLQEKALRHKQRTYFKTSGAYDPYDNIRAWLYTYNTPIVFGTKFGWPLEQFVLNGTPDGSGHAMAFFGYDEMGLDAVNSAGLGAGQSGHHRISRETVNEYIPKYGAYMHLDMPREEANALEDKYRTSQLPFWRRIIISLWNWK